jgi:hypothetical protein
MSITTGQINDYINAHAEMERAEQAYQDAQNDFGHAAAPFTHAPAGVYLGDHGAIVKHDAKGIHIERHIVRG